MATTLLLADDHTLFRRALVARIALAPDLEVVAEAADGPETIEMTLQHRPNVVLLDYAMPELEGPEVARRILEQLPCTHIVALSMHGEAQYVQTMLDAGVDAYVLKSDAVSEIVKAIHAVGDGHRYLSKSVRQVAHFKSP